MVEGGQSGPQRPRGNGGSRQMLADGPPALASLAAARAKAHNLPGARLSSSNH